MYLWIINIEFTNVYNVIKITLHPPFFINIFFVIYFSLYNTQQVISLQYCIIYRLFSIYKHYHIFQLLLQVFHMVLHHNTTTRLVSWDHN